MKRFFPRFFQLPPGNVMARNYLSLNRRPMSTLVMPVLINSNLALESEALIYRKQRLEFDRKLEQYWLSGERKCMGGDYSRALYDYQGILALMRGEEVNNLTQNQKVLLAKAYAKSARILNVGTVDDEKLAVDYLDKALELVPDLKMALDLRQSILSDNAISPAHLNNSSDGM